MSFIQGTDQSEHRFIGILVKISSIPEIQYFQYFTHIVTEKKEYFLNKYIKRPQVRSAA